MSKKGSARFILERIRSEMRIPMKETIATIPLMDALAEKDECLFCYLEREAEQHAISFILGSAYMEDDIRMKTDEQGFCRRHYKMMYDYGNRLGSALILSSHLKKLNQELSQELKNFKPEKSAFFQRFKKTEADSSHPKTSLGNWILEKESSCYVCDHFQSIYNRYLDTFFSLYRKNEEFRTAFLEGKGICLPHFRDILEISESKLSDSEKKEFYPAVFSLMQKNLQRLQEEVSWFVEKNDHRNKDKSWGNSADSIQRAMQKCAGGYPADPIFKAKL